MSKQKVSWNKLSNLIDRYSTVPYYWLNDDGNYEVYLTLGGMIFYAVIRKDIENPSKTDFEDNYKAGSG